MNTIHSAGTSLWLYGLIFSCLLSHITFVGHTTTIREIIYCFVGFDFFFFFVLLFCERLVFSVSLHMESIFNNNINYNLKKEDKLFRNYQYMLISKIYFIDKSYALQKAKDDKIEIIQKNLKLQKNLKIMYMKIKFSI